MPHSPLAPRRAALRERLRRHNLDAVLVTNPENRYYLTGFYAHDDGLDSAGRVLLTQDHAVLFTDGRYSEQAHEEAQGITVVDSREPLPKLIAASLRQWGWPSGAERQTLGIEAEHLTVAQHKALVAAGRGLFAVKPTRHLVEPLREVKDAEEIALTRKAAEITSQVFAHLLDYLHQPHLTEQDVAIEIFITMRKLGAEGTSFASIVAAGPNSARPHTDPSDRLLMPGEPIIIDMGARYHGYCADMTRTVFIDLVPPLWGDRYQHVLAAQQACVKGVRANMPGKAADALARDALIAVGLGDYYVHGTGHGTGLEIHEDPRLSAHAPESALMPEGSIITIEPGVYFAGEGGVRIEDQAVLGRNGCDVLTTAPRALAAMIIPR
jgi:Xaa-Pro aminopeptidase